MISIANWYEPLFVLYIKALIQMGSSFQKLNQSEKAEKVFAIATEFAHLAYMEFPESEEVGGLYNWISNCVSSRDLSFK